jgi:hypothetical protein
VTLVRDANHQRMAEAVETFSLQLRHGVCADPSRDVSDGDERQRCR